MSFNCVEREKRTRRKMRVLFAWSIVCALTVVSGQEPCVRTSGFIPLSNLTVLAQSPSDDIFGCTDDVCLRHVQQRLIPQIKFTCNGTITKWTFAALFENFIFIFPIFVPLTEYPELQLWRLDNGQTDTYTKVGSCTTSNVAEENPSRIYECIPSSPLRFEAGNVLGIFQPFLSRLSVYYDVRIGPLNYFEEFGATATPSFDITGADTENETALPLVTVEISVDCGILTDPENGQVTLTGTTEGSTATYSCNTGYSLMGVSMRTCQSDGMWSDQPPACTPVTPSPIAPSSPVMLTSSTDEAVSTPGSIATAPLSMPQSPNATTGTIPTVLATSAVSMESTTQIPPPVGSLTATSSLSQLSTPPSPIAPSSPVMLTSSTDEAVSTPGSIAAAPLSMPQLPIATSGAIPIVLSMMATSAASVESTISLPPPVRSSTAPPSLSQLSTPPIAASPTSQASSPLETTMSTPDETVSPTTSSEIEGMIENSQNPSGEPPSPTGVVSVTPALQVPPESPTDITSPPQESSTASAPPLGNTGSSSSSAIAGAVVGAFVAVLLAFAVVVLLLIVLRKRRRRKHTFTTAVGGDTTTPVIVNPVYSGDVPGKYLGGGTGTEDAAAYDYIAVASRGIYQSIDEQSQHYEEPENVKHAMENGTGRRNIYSTLSSGATNSKPLAAESLYEDAAGVREYASATFYQWGVYVPSEEERRNFATGDGQTTSEVGENVYAALGEAQFKAGYVSSGPSPAFFEDSNTYWKPSSDKSELYEQLATKKYREIPRHQVQITDNLGEGQFGTVNKGIWQSPAGAKEVAVKTLKSQASEMDAVKFLQEAAINGQFKHPNIVTLLGVVTLGKPVMIVLELLANGDLRHYLNKQQPAPGEMVPSSTPPMLLNFCQQVAAGMEYLAGKAFIHRDLAARNILVSEDKTCKVSDFGMSRDLADESYYVSHGGKIPVKWTAPEALHYKKYSTASDVWSFGAVMYEIWSLGHKPFEGRTNSETIKLLGSGYRLPPPPGCPREIYKWMIRCWHPERHARPQFSQLSEALNQPDLDLLTWSEEDAGVHPQAMVLGAPLEAGKQLYPELQDIYVEKRSPATQIATL